MSLEINKIGIKIGPFHSFGLSRLQHKAQNRRLFNIKVIQKYNIVNSDINKFQALVFEKNELKIEISLYWQRFWSIIIPISM